MVNCTPKQISYKVGIINKMIIKNHFIYKMTKEIYHSNQIITKKLLLTINFLKTKA